MKILKIIILGMLLFSTQIILFADETKLSLNGWVGLWNEEMVEWAENENRIHRLCEKSKLSQDQVAECKKKYLSSKTWSITAFSSPNKKSEKLGEILITVKPGSSFLATIKPKNEKEIDFTPDLYDRDWGYGPYFHQTILDKKSDWLQVALLGLKAPAWINPKNDIKFEDIKSIELGNIYSFNSKSIVIIKKDNKAIKYRMENKSDMWCDVGTPPKIPSGEIKTINIKDLFENGHLKLDIKYKRGC